MFFKLKIRLTLICTCSTTLLVLVIVLSCLRVSETNMYGQEKALFLLHANTITSDLHTFDRISIHWYTRNMNNQNILWLEFNQEPSSLSSVIVKDEKLLLVQELKDALKKESDFLEFRNVSMGVCQRQFLWTSAVRGSKFLVMQTWLSEGTQKAEYLYLYSLEGLYDRMHRQRIRFFAIWFFSVAVLSVFSYLFTARALKPIVENNERQRHFVSVASHELRSPLAVIKTGLSILKTESERCDTGLV